MGAAEEPLTVVICVDHASVTGGQAKVAFDSARGLLAAGHHPILFTGAGPVSDDLKASGVEVICLDQPDLVSNPSKLAGAVQGFWNAKAAAALAKLLGACPKGRTVVHVHGWAKALSPAIGKPIAASGLPAIYTIHEYFLFCPNGGFYNYQKNEVCQLKPMSASCLSTHCDSRTYPRKLWRSARLMAAQNIVRMPSVFSDYICISGHQSEIVAPYLPKGVRVHRVSNPIEADNLGPKPHPASGDLIFVGRLSAEKGAFLFAEAAERANVTATFIGDGPLREELQARHPTARFLGWQPSDKVREHMRAAVVVSDICAGREEIQDGVSGLWFKSADAGALTNALKRLSDDALVARMSNAAHADYWSDPPTLEAHIARVVAVYAGMLEQRRLAA